MTVFKKCISVLLMLSLLVVLFSFFSVNSFAADGITVDIVSFTRGAQSDLRSSELLEAKVTGYSGNVRELTYKWTSSLGTYLYVYNSHNMYGINNTDGEIEIYNSDKRLSGSSNMSGRTYNKTFTGVGYAWASVYGAGVSSENLVGKVTVDVYDANGKLLASDTHEGTRVNTGSSWWRPNYKNYGFVASDLADDVSHVYFGLFEGDTKNVKILLGESSIVHITCEECTVSDPDIVSGDGIIKIVVDKETQEAHIKSIAGTSDGDAKVQITITKGNCKFHKDVSTTRTIDVYVYKKPTTTSTSTVITLDNLDDRCKYYIGGAMGQRKTVDGKEYVVFEGLTPNTEYQIEVVGQANSNTDPVYAYVYETTKPAHTGTVEVILNGEYNTATGEATGTRVDINEVMPSVETLYLRYEDSQIYFPLEKIETGVYTSVLSDGNYTAYYSVSGSDEKISLGDQMLTINGASRTRELFFNSVTYNTNGGDAALPVEYYLVESKVTVTDTVPLKEGYLFTHWTDEDGNVYKSGDTLTDAIGKAYKLTAQYVEAFDVYVNIIIRHLAENGSGCNNDGGMHNIKFTVDQRFGGEGDYTERVAHNITWDGLSDFTNPDYNAEYISNDGLNRTVYSGTAPALANVAKEAEYTVTSVKSGYTRILNGPDGIKKELDENGDLHITVEFIYDPNDFDLLFEVELDEKSKNVANELKPAAVNVKVTAWGDPLDVEGEEVMWTTITQMPHTYERIALDENGKGSGTYPVWIATTDTDTPYAYRIEVVSYETADGTILPAYNDKENNNENIVYRTQNNRYYTTVTVTGGKTPQGSTLNGAFYDNGTQNGNIKGIVTIDVFDVTFVPNGGTLHGSADNTVLSYQIGIPKLSEYVPVREGGYVFEGWYVADENGNVTDKAAVSEEIIFENTTLVAKWKEPLTVKGQVAVAGTYTLNEDGMPTVHTIPEHDRIKSEVVLLQRIGANGYAETIKSVTVPISYSDDYGIGTYKFEGIEDNGHAYRIKIVSSNYHSHYFNEETSGDVNEFADYVEEANGTSYLAAFGGDTVADVHVYLHFQPENFTLEYEIDATAIGPYHKPSAVEMLVLCDTGAHIDPQHWDVISQMVHGDSHVGNRNTVSEGKGKGSEAVWNVKPDGGTPYHYSIRVKSLEFGNLEFEYTDDLPFVIHYNGSTRFSDVSGEQTQMLTATMVPRMYTITFDMGNLKEGSIVENMTQYATLNKTFEDTYYWSHGKAVTAEPKVEGYTFLGWYDENGNKVTNLVESTAGNIVLTAKWSANIAFDIMVDAGYYSEKRDSEEKEGIIAFNARVKDIATAKKLVDTFGIYVYDTTGENIKVTSSSTSIEQLEKDNGEFHITVSGIALENFSSNVLAVPYVVVNGEVIAGTPMRVSVSAVNKWLGPKSESKEG